MQFCKYFIFFHFFIKYQIIIQYLKRQRSLYVRLLIDRSSDNPLSEKFPLPL